MESFTSPSPSGKTPPGHTEFTWLRPSAERCHGVPPGHTEFTWDDSGGGAAATVGASNTFTQPPPSGKTPTMTDRTPCPSDASTPRVHGHQTYEALTAQLPNMTPPANGAENGVSAYDPRTAQGGPDPVVRAMSFESEDDGERARGGEASAEVTAGVTAEDAEERALRALEATLGGGESTALAAACRDPQRRAELAKLCAEAAKAVSKDGVKSLAWARQALGFVDGHGHASLCEAQALDELGYLAAAEGKLKQLAAGRPGSEHTKEAKKILQLGVEESLLQPYSLPCRLAGLRDQPGCPTNLINQKRLEEAQKDGMETMDGTSPIKILNRITNGDTCIEDALLLGEGEDGFLKPADRIRAESFLKAYDVKGPPRPREGETILLRTLLARQGSGVTVVSWNAQLMNKLDGPNDKEIGDAIRAKARNIGAVAAKTGAALLVIQEAPGPQLRKSGGVNSKRIAKERRFKEALLQELPAGFKAADVELHNMKPTGAGGNSEMGEDHIFCYDSAVMRLVEGPTPLSPCVEDIAADGSADLSVRRRKSWRVAGSDGGWVGRAPSWAEFCVQKWGLGRLLVVSVHAKSGGGPATKQDVAMIGRAVLQLQAERRDSGTGSFSILITGDFNLGPSQVKAAFVEAGLVEFRPTFGKDAPSTNIWRFNGVGDEGKDGHAYDSGFFWSSEEHSTVGAVLAPAPEMEQAHAEMRHVAMQLRACLAMCQDQGAGGVGPPPPLCATTQQALAALVDVGDSPDGVMSWLRKRFCHAIKLNWADHLPISMSITMPAAT